MAFSSPKFPNSFHNPSNKQHGQAHQGNSPVSGTNFYLSLINAMNKGDLEEGGLFQLTLAGHCLSLKGTGAGNWRQGLQQRPRGVVDALYGFLTQSKATHLQLPSPTVGWALPGQSLIKTMPHECAQRPI